MEPTFHEGYCVKCKQKKQFQEAETGTMKNGASMAKGPCPACGTKICRILPKAKVEE